MKKYLFILVALCSLITGCRSGARKDVYFRSRLPTMELPAFRDGSGFGVRADVETVRATIHATNNLLTDFSYHNDKINFSDSDSVSGVDVFFTYKNEVEQIPLEFGASFDGVEARAGLLGFREPSTEKWFLMGNYGLYSVAAYSESGNKCDFICFVNQESSDSSETAQNNIDLTMNGYESKIGATLGHRWDEKSSVMISYNWMQHYYRSKATKITTGEQIRFSEQTQSYGIGLGYMHNINPSMALGVSADRIIMTWNDRDSERYSFGLRFMSGL